LRSPTLGILVGAVLAIVGFLFGSPGFSDNSFLTHLATGRLILDSGSVPSTDPYTFTAQGEPWVVQSWLVSVLFAAIEELVGPAGIRLVVGGIAAAVVAIAWMLTSSAQSIFARVALIGLVLAVAAQTWAERPFLVGLLLLAIAMLVEERRWSPWWLVPAGWVWANSHGSFPLGIIVLVLLAVGRRLDGDRWTHAAGCAASLAGGVVAGVIGPLGPRLLLFPVQLVAGNEVLQEVLEWQAPRFDSMSQRLFLVQLALAVALLVRRPSWRVGLPMFGFALAALTSLRNVSVASIVLIPGMAASMPSIGQLRATMRPRLGPVLAAGLVALTGVVVAGRLAEDDYRLAGSYPALALEWMAANELEPSPMHRVAAPEIVGNLLNLLYADSGVTYYDDRFDMFPEDVSEGFLRLRRGSPGWRTSLEDDRINTVVWQRADILGQLLEADPGWSAVYVDDTWGVFRHR
jgi:hypothetical protein